jgi:hypothetical protein
VSKFDVVGSNVVASSEGGCMRTSLLILACTVALVAWAVPAAAAPTPVTYLNANFGPPNTSGTAFYRSTGTLHFQSATANVSAQARDSQVQFSASANNDPNETSSGFSSYDIGTVNAGTGSFNVTSVSPRTLELSGSAHFAMNLWFDSDHNGEYFVWDHNEFSGLGGDVYAIGPSGNGPVTIDQTTPLFLIPYCNPGVNLTTLAVINAGGCTTIPLNTHVARWVGIDIAGNTSGSGNAAL